MAKADTFKDAGNKYFKNEDYVRAIKCYKEGLRLDPSNATINCNLSQAYLAVKEFAEAEVHAVVTLAHQADSVKGFYRATKAALGMAKREKALSYLRAGLVNCPKAEELKTLYEELSKENEDAASPNSSNIKPHSEKEESKKNLPTLRDGQGQHVNSSERERPSRSDQNKLRSRSSGSCNRNSSKNATDKVNVRSISVNRSSNEKSQRKRNSESKSDEFLDTLVKMQKELSPEEKSPQQKEREALMEKQKKLQIYMKDGSQAMEIGLAKQASEKYKSALDIMTECNIEVFGLPEVDRIVLRYSLSICWIETLNYNNIVQSVGCLMEIEMSHAMELPAVYFGLGRAFYRLNRYKVALDHLDKGLKTIENSTEIIPHPWPGTMKTIVETTKVGLKESLNKLCYECRMYREPDAVCRYQECLSVNTHICPSEIIFYSDPDFVGFVAIICQENCRITYHVGCWKHYKESLSSVGKLIDKDMLGRNCLTSDCLNDRNEMSVIVRVEVYGEDNKIKTSCSKEPTKTDNVNEHRKERKKKNEKVDKPVKVKVTRIRVKKIPPSAPSSIVKKIKRKSTISSEDLTLCKQRLTDLREINFGVEEALGWCPQKDYFGRPDISTLKSFINSKDSDVLRERKNFIYTYFYEYLNDEGPQKVSTIEKKWLEDISQFPGINEFMSQHDGICDFLLQSYRFACIDDYLCLAEQLSDTYERVKEEVGESLTFILSHSSLSIENEPEGDLVVNKCARELIEDTNSNNCILDNEVGHQEAIAPSSSQGHSSEITWNKRDSECDSYMIQDTSTSSVGEESDYDGIITSDSENEVDFETINISNISNEAYLNNNIAQVQESTPAQPPVSDKLNDISYSPSANCSSSTGSIYYELSDKDIKEFQIADAATQVVDLCLALKDANTQTDSSCDLEKENEALKTTNVQLRHAAATWNDEKQKLVSSHQEEINEYKKKIQVYENRLSSLVIEKEQSENDLQFQIGIRDSKFDAIVKRHHEEISSLTKKKEEDACLLKKNLGTMTELNKEVEKQAKTVNRLEDQLRRANEQILTIRKSFGEFKLDSYLAKCKERLQCMNLMSKCFQDTSPNIDEIKPAIEAWERVAVVLQETRDLLQVQYDILSQQLKNKVSSDCLLQLELADLPTEPYYPLQDMNNVLRLAMECVQHNSHSLNGKNMMNTTQNNFQYIDTPSTYLPSMLGIQNLPPQDAFSRRATNSFGFRPPFYSNSFSALPRTMSPTPNNNNVSSQSSCELQNKNNTTTGSWPSVPQIDGLRNEPLEMINVTGGKQNSNLRAAESVAPPFIVPVNNFGESRETLTSGEYACQNTGDKISEGSSLVEETKQKDTFGEKKSSISSASGLTPIEITKSINFDCRGATSKTMNMETKLSVKPSTQSEKRWNYQKLFEELQNNFKMTPEVELSECLFIVREKNANKLSGLSVSTIIRRVEKVLEERSSKRVGNMGMDKFGGAAWGEVKENNVNWQNDDDVENECIICHVNIEANNKTSLQCKHTFHTECIRQWLHTNSTCPICRKYTRLIDEFPPLA